MFAHIVTAAKGLFTRHPEDHSDPAGPSATDSKMVIATRQGEISPNVAAGKRKTRPTSAGKPGGQDTKRKRSNSKATDTSADAVNGAPETSKVIEAKAPAGKKIRFGSEEPEPIEAQPEEIEELPKEDEEEDEDSDDDAPETIVNSAQLLKMKELAKKQEAAKQIEDQLKREKRRKLDERRKLQAKAKEVPADDMMSESTATLQGTTTQDARRAALPALLPDDILNAEPALRAPTPPAEDLFALPKKSNKLRFLDKKDKIPKDINLDDVSIRVLDAPSARKSSKPALPPKVSKIGKNVKNGLLQKTRNTAKSNGLRKKASGPGGFVRR